MFGVIIGLMGAMGIILVLISSIIHRNLMIDDHKTSLIKLVQLQTNHVINRLETDSRDLGLALQSNAEFRTAFGEQDVVKIKKLLSNQFRQYFVTAGIIKLERLVVFDKYFELIAGATTTTSPLPRGVLVCRKFVRKASIRQGPDRVRIFSGICRHAGRPYHSVIVPIGGLKPTGYLQVITDLSHSMTRTERGIGLPLRLSLMSNEIVYQSKKWPDKGAMDESEITEYTIKTHRNHDVLKLELASDYSGLYAKLINARNIVIAIAGAITLLVIIAGLILLRMTTFRPLNILSNQIQRVRSDRPKLGDQINIEGASEISEFATSFNEMNTELNTLYDTLEHMAYTDPLTSLPNRNLFHDQIQKLVLQNQKAKRPFALFMMDLNRFKEVNDALGHDAGDNLLQEVANRFKHVLRQPELMSSETDIRTSLMDYDLLARLGGDEFAAILQGVESTTQAEAVVRKLFKEIEKPFLIHDNKFIIGVSIGIVIYPQHGKDKYTLLRRADVAMYYAKRTKRGYAFYESEQETHSLHQLNLEKELITAVEKDELILYYQPKIDIKSGKVQGVESLLRWRHPDKGILSPDRFIRLAEETDIIDKITTWVLGKALNDCYLWQKQGYQFGVSINLSALNLHDPGIIDVVSKMLRKSRVNPRYLTIELTESSVMLDPNHSIQILSGFREIGLRLAIDDFGTGYSSLTYIKRLPVDEIKIDKAFIIDLTKDKNDEAIVRSTITLAHNMGMEVIAEGVEDAATLSSLAHIGCDIAQGFYLSHPLPLASLIDWLEKGGDSNIIFIDQHLHKK